MRILGSAASIYLILHQVSVSNTFDGSSPSYICEEARKHSKGHDAAFGRTARLNGRISCRMTAECQLKHEYDSI